MGNTILAPENGETEQNETSSIEPCYQPEKKETKGIDYASASCCSKEVIHFETLCILSRFLYKQKAKYCKVMLQISKKCRLVGNSEGTIQQNSF